MSTTILGVAIRDLNRLAAVSRTVAKHGFGAFVRRSAIGPKVFEGGAPPPSEEPPEAPPAERFRRLLEELGPTYIKLGQILSMRADLLPPDWIASLAKLQDDAPLVPFEDVQRVIEEGLGKPPEELFARFERRPLGTASIGQTHAATTHDGREVVVKVQRPGIEEVLRSDLDLLYLAARLLESGVEELKIVGIASVIAEFEAALLSELNYTSELSNLLAMHQLLDPDRSVVVPEPYPELSSRTVLTMQRFHGKPIRAIERGSAEARHAAEEIVHAACKQVLVDGLFHGDPHPGNILIDEQGTLCMIDLGLVGRLSPEQREDLVTLIVAAITNDVATIARVLLKIGNPTERVSLNELRGEITRIRTKYLEVGSFEQVDTAGFAEEFNAAAQRFKIRLNHSYSVLFKAGATLEGVIRDLDADVAMVAIATPYAERLVRERYAPARLLGEALGGVTGVGSLLRQIPGHLDQILHDFETGNVQVRAVTPQLDAIAPGLHRFGTRVILTGLAATLSLCATILYATASAERPHTWAIALTLAGAVIAWLFLLGGSLVTGKALRVSPWMELLRRRGPER